MSAIQHQLRLRHHRAEFTGFSFDLRLPYHGRAAAMERRTFRADALLRDLGERDAE